MKKQRASLRLGLQITILICWLVPVVIIVALAGALLGNSYQNSVEQEIDASAKNAMDYVQIQLEAAISDSKAVSYDGAVRSAYRTYQQNGNFAALYRSVTDYLSENFSREEQYKVVFISFWNELSEANAYQLGKGTTGYELLQQAQDSTPYILEEMADADTNIRFLTLKGQMYMARNLLDSSFEPYATVVMMLDPASIFQPLGAISRVRDMMLKIDDCEFQLENSGNYVVDAYGRTPQTDISYQVEADGHIFTLTAGLEEYNLWEENSWLWWAIVGVALMVLPLLAVIIGLFYRHVTRPMETLVKANLRVQSGERGYEITQSPPNEEFAKLYSHFNAMSTELNRQFEQSYLEQQATQRAQIKALQSQINPHFLNNTLEIINWEARFAENHRVSAMIEALSTMLDAALDRDGRTQITLREEMGYVDAYLYIIQERLGSGFHVRKDIEPDVMDQMIPRLILQPIVENAVEHDITARRGGNLWLRAYRKEERMVLEVEHDGTMSDADRENIRRLLSETELDSSRVGLKNVSQRLRLLYGEESRLTVEEGGAGTILARLSFPAA